MIHSLALFWVLFIFISQYETINAEKKPFSNSVDIRIESRLVVSGMASQRDILEGIADQKTIEKRQTRETHDHLLIDNDTKKRYLLYNGNAPAYNPFSILGKRDI